MIYCLLASLMLLISGCQFAITQEASYAPVVDAIPSRLHHDSSIKKQVKVVPYRWSLQRPSQKPAQKTYSSSTLIWPTHGKILRAYAPDLGRKGIDIGGQRGQAVRSIAEGQVVYSGEGLKYYGKLLIIKHRKNLMSTYAHNQTLLVKEGQKIQTGQVIATMGDTGVKRVMLHFELRRSGKTVNPLDFIKKIS